MERNCNKSIKTNAYLAAGNANVHRAVISEQYSGYLMYNLQMEEKQWNIIILNLFACSANYS